MRRRILNPAIFGLQIFAIILALFQWQAGVRTDEAKYLLNIPYPHPPGARWVLSLLKTWEYQEIFWRVVFATLLVQAVWLVWDLALALPRSQRMIIAAAWLFSSAVLLQAGTVMMAPLTALQMLVFVWLASRPELAERYRGSVAFFWLFSVFTAYQAVLFLPLVALLFHRMKVPLWQRWSFVLLPVLLLALYTLANPLSAASFGVHAGRQVGESLPVRLQGFLGVWALGGSVVVSILGTVGIFQSRRPDVILSFLLVSAYVGFSRYDYYAILFVPLFVTGLLSLPLLARKNGQIPFCIALVLGALSMTLLHPLPAPSVARSVMQSLHLQETDLILIQGSYGHEWQYESPAIVRKYTPSLLTEVKAVICLETCPVFDKTGWERIPAAVETWVRS